MTDPRRSEQRRVLVGMAAAAAATAIGLTAGIGTVAPLLPPLPTAGERLAFVLRTDLFLAVPLAASIAAVAHGRFLSADDIAGSAFAEPGPRIRVAVAVLRNTLEQTVLGFVVHVGLAAVLPPEQIAAVPILTAMFVVGRCCFALGYARGAAARAFGFGLTFYPTVAALAWGLAIASG